MKQFHVFSIIAYLLPPSLRWLNFLLTNLKILRKLIIKFSTLFEAHLF